MIVRFVYNDFEQLVAVAGKRKSHPKEWLFPDNANQARSCSVARRSPVNLHLSHAAAHTIESGG